MRLSGETSLIHGEPFGGRFGRSFFLFFGIPNARRDWMKVVIRWFMIAGSSLFGVVAEQAPGGGFIALPSATALMRTPATPGAILYTLGFSTPGDGGAAWYIGEKAQGIPTPGEIRGAEGTGVWRIVPTDGTVNVKAFGAKGDNVADDTEPIQKAVEYQQSHTNVSKIHFPAGTYRLGATLAPKKRIWIEGDLPADQFSKSGASVINFTRDNEPIIRLGGNGTPASQNAVKNLGLRYAQQQPPQATKAACIQLAHDTHLDKFENLFLEGGAYGILQREGDASWQNDFRNIHIYSYSISGISLGAAGTEWTWSQIYIQNLSPAYHPPSVAVAYARISSVTKASPTTLSVTLEKMPPLIQPNFMIDIARLEPAKYNTAYFVKNISGNTLTVDAKDDYGPVTVIPGSSGLILNAHLATGPAVSINGGNHAITGLDVEWTVTSDSSLIHLNCETCVISDLHLESVFCTNPTFRLIRSESKALDINVMDFINSGAFPGQTVSLILNANNEKGGGPIISHLHIRDFAHKGAHWSLAEKTRNAGEVVLRRLSTTGTVRVNADPLPDSYGPLARPTEVSFEKERANQ